MTASATAAPCLAPPDEFAVPAGDPQAVGRSAAALRAARKELIGAGARLDGTVTGWRPDWQGVAADAAGVVVHATGSAVGLTVDPLEQAASALDDWARALADAQVAMGRLRRQSDEKAEFHSRRHWQLNEAIKAANLRQLTENPMTAWTGPSPEVQALTQHLASLDQQATSDKQGLRRDARSVIAKLDQVAVDVRRRLELARTVSSRATNENLQSWQERNLAGLARTAPPLAGSGRTLDDAVWVLLNQAGLRDAAATSWQAWRALRGATGVVEQLSAGDLPAGLRLAQRVSPAVRGALAEDGVQLALHGAQPGESLATLARQAGAKNLLTQAQSVADLTHAAGVLRVAGVAGAAVGTVVAGANLVSDGNPVAAFKRDKVGYVADVADFAFNASTTALLVAPSPVTLGAAAVTGALYAGVTLYANRKKVLNVAAATGRTVARAQDAVDDAVADGVSAVGRGAFTVAKSIGSALNPFD